MKIWCLSLGCCWQAILWVRHPSCSLLEVPKGGQGPGAKSPSYWVAATSPQPPSLPSAASAEENHTANPTLVGSLCPAARARASQAGLYSCPEPQGRVAALFCWSQWPPCVGPLLLPWRGLQRGIWLFSATQKHWYFPGQKAGHHRPWAFSIDACKTCCWNSQVAINNY